MKAYGGVDSSVCIVTGYGLHNRGVGVRVPVGSKMHMLHIELSTILSEREYSCHKREIIAH
jgi:hypothetical protein